MSARGGTRELTEVFSIIPFIRLRPHDPITATQLHRTGGSAQHTNGEGRGHKHSVCGCKSSGHPASLPTLSPLSPPAFSMAATKPTLPPPPTPEGELCAKTRYYTAWPAMGASMVTLWGPRLKETSSWKLRFLSLQAPPSHTILKVVRPKCELSGDLPNYKASIYSLATS